MVLKVWNDGCYSMPRPAARQFACMRNPTLRRVFVQQIDLPTVKSGERSMAPPTTARGLLTANILTHETSVHSAPGSIVGPECCACCLLSAFFCLVPQRGWVPCRLEIFRSFFLFFITYIPRSCSIETHNRTPCYYNLFCGPKTVCVSSAKKKQLKKMVHGLHS